MSIGDPVLGYPIACWPHAPREMVVVALPSPGLAICEWDENGGFGTCRIVMETKNLVRLNESCRAVAQDKTKAITWRDQKPMI
jgi:hypothetical protein